MSDTPISRSLYCFKRWSRKKFSVLLSLSKIVKIGVLSLTYSLVNRMPVLIAQPDTITASVKHLEEIEITGNRSPVVASGITRLVSVIKRDEIEKSGIQNFQDLLEFVSNVDIRQRGPYGIQSDVSIRGSSFDHVMILLNGVNLSDAQTGHLSFDLPVDIETIERIEILEGSAARTFGPGAFMGAINIVTVKNNEPNIGFSQSAGEHHLYRTHLDGSFHTGTALHLLSASYASSGGYAPYTKFKNYNLYYGARVSAKKSVIDIQAGYQQKEFGAGGFYSPRFPDQNEETGATFMSLGASTNDFIKVASKVYWRRKQDHFRIFAGDRFDNYHLSNTYGSQLNLSAQAGPVVTTLGFDIRSEGILSNNIGFEYPDPKPVKGADGVFYTRQYSRNNFAGFLEGLLIVKDWHFSAGLMVNWNSGFQYTPSVCPGLDVSYRLSPAFTVFGSVNRSLHLPTFTDMFYRDPVNQGNLELLPNRMVSSEAGFKYHDEQSEWKVAGFYNKGHDIVDWLWSYQINKFRPFNLHKYVVKGISVNYTAHFSHYNLLKRLMNPVIVNWTYMDIQKSTSDSVSKYNNLKQKLSILLVQPVIDHFSITWMISYQQRNGEAILFNSESGYHSMSYKPIWLLDFSARWDIKSLQIYTEVSNLFNTRYLDAGTAIQPGRWSKIGLVYTFSFRKSDNQ